MADHELRGTVSEQWCGVGLIGRVQVVVLLRVMGLSCFGALVVLYHYKFNKWLVVVAYILRTVFMNATYPLEESILMDYVPKKQRARWKSLESVSSFGWCGSAFIGGYLADKYDYTTTFIITIAIQTMATAMYSLLCTLVINKPPSQAKKDSTLQGGSNVASTSIANTSNEHYDCD